MSQPMMVFHSPRPFESEPRAGSSAHVTRMAQAFESIGYDVLYVCGHTRERRAAMRLVIGLLESGADIRFAYSEASTAPTSMNDAHHLPLRPLLDWRFLRKLRRSGVGVGLFYPDVYWRFSVYRSTVPWHRRLPALMMYRFDLLWYRDAVDVLFLPSIRMADALPGWGPTGRIEALAPGGSGNPMGWTPHDGLRLLYVGSVTPPLYDLAPLLDAVRQVPDVCLTICCPREQARVLESYGSDGRVTVVHEHGDALSALYAACDAACLVFAADPYRDFAMPVKLFEALGSGRPVIASAGTAVADFVEVTSTGWAVKDGELVELLTMLASTPASIEERRRAVLSELPKHTWSERARLVADRLGADAPGFAR